MSRVEASQIWGNLVEVNKRGELFWKENRLNILRGSNDSRLHPEKYIAMSGKQVSWNSSGPKIFNPPDLAKLEDGSFESREGVKTNVVGLLQLTGMFHNIPKNPSNVLLVGAISDKSLKCALEWVDRNCRKATTTLVDKSPIPLKHIEILTDLGYFDGSPEFKLLESDVLNYRPEQKLKIIVSDLTNVWTISRHSLNGPNIYDGFSKLTSWSRDNLSKKGVLLSRCVVYPKGSSNANLNVVGPLNANSLLRADMVRSQLGGMSQDIDQKWLDESIAELYKDSNPSTFCGLGGLYRTFTEHPTLEGESAEKVMRRIHQKYFAEVEEIKIKDLVSGATYINFSCRN